MTTTTDRSADRDAFPIIGSAALEAAAMKKHGCHAWQLDTNDRELLRADLPTEVPTTPEAWLPECGCTAVDVPEDADGNLDYSTAEVVHECAGRDVRPTTLWDGRRITEGYAVKVDDLGTLGDWIGSDPEVSAFDEFSLTVYGRLVRELTAAQRVEVLDRYDDTEVARSERASTAAQLRRTTEPCGCTEVGALLRNDGTRDFEHLFRWHNDDTCAIYGGEPVDDAS